MRISVIMPVYNAEKYLKEAIDGLLNQSCGHFELLIADDGSTDGTRAIINDFAARDERIKTSHNSENAGKTATVNRLFKQCQGEFITVHDADDISHRQRFEKQLEAFEKDPQLALCGTSFCSVNEQGFVIEETQMPVDYKAILTGIERASQFHGPTMMIKRTVLQNLDELYRPYFRDNYEDTDLAYRITENNKATNLKENLYIYRILENSLCRKDVDIRNRNLYNVVAYLGHQRKVDGSDALMKNKPHEADEFLNRVTQHYQKDTSLIYREAASYYFYWKLNRKALQAAWKGFLRKPLKKENIRTLLYILRKRLLNVYHAKTVKEHYREILLKTF